MANYNKLATLMGDHQEMATFRRFKRLNAKSLLYMQAEIVHLESELGNIESEDKWSEDKPRSSLHESVFNLQGSHGTPSDVQWKKVLDIREKLKQYSKLGNLSSSTDTNQGQDKALLLSSRVQALPKPCARDLHTLQEWLERPEGGDFFLQGREADTWKDDHDVLTLSPRQAERDYLTGLVNDMVIPWYHCFCGRWSKVRLSSLGPG
ncbi:MAG: hypothetical protein L6R40_008646 [Gallowayella cf. fulva]|nr:MAG: hypothetical protein L6R40_008646 [Xanthomendoza cf. fulva]